MKNEQNIEKPKKWIKFVDKRGVKISVGVFGSETDKEALARARAIDARVGDKSTF